MADADGDGMCRRLDTGDGAAVGHFAVDGDADGAAAGLYAVEAAHRLAGIVARRDAGRDGEAHAVRLGVVLELAEMGDFDGDFGAGGDVAERRGKDVGGSEVLLQEGGRVTLARGIVVRLFGGL